MLSGIEIFKFFVSDHLKLVFYLRIPLSINNVAVG